MVVKKMWQTEVKRPYGKPFYYDGRDWFKVTKHWEGFFLFGIIPLYICQTRTIYHK